MEEPAFSLPSLHAFFASRFTAHYYLGAWNRSAKNGASGCRYRSICDMYDLNEVEVDHITAETTPTILEQ